MRPRPVCGNWKQNGGPRMRFLLLAGVLALFLAGCGKAPTAPKVDQVQRGQADPTPMIIIKDDL